MGWGGFSLGLACGGVGWGGFVKLPKILGWVGVGWFVGGFLFKFLSLLFISNFIVKYIY